jgi:hypothetical protein
VVTIEPHLKLIINPDFSFKVVVHELEVAKCHRIYDINNISVIGVLPILNMIAVHHACPGVGLRDGELPDQKYSNSLRPYHLQRIPSIKFIYKSKDCKLLVEDPKCATCIKVFKVYFEKIANHLYNIIVRCNK